MDKKCDRISLSKLYKTEHIRGLVWEILSEDFDNTFNRLMKEGINIRSLLINSAKLNKCLIRELVIEFGYEFENLEHLKICLDALKQCDKVDECDSAPKSLNGEINEETQSLD